MLERIDLTRDLHFYTRTTIDTLDYSGSGLNSGSKVVIAAAGEKLRELGTELPVFNLPDGFRDPRIVMPGVIAIQADRYTDAAAATKGIHQLTQSIGTTTHSPATNNRQPTTNFPLVVICDDSDFLARSMNNFLWVTFTRSNPAADIHGVDSFTADKHWGCNGPLIIDARIKPHHAPPLIKDPAIEKRVDRLGEKGGSLHGII